MGDYLTMIEYGKKSVDDYVLTIEKQLARAYIETYKTIDAEILSLYAKLGDKANLPEAQKYKRLENLKADIAKEYRGLTGKSITMCGDTSEQSYVGAFEQAWFNIEKSVGASLNFGIPPVDAIRASVFSEYSGAAFPYRFGKLFTSTTDKIAEAITRGLATGHGYRKTAGEIKGYFDGSYKDALRVIRTESTRNFTEGNNFAYQQAKDQGIEGVETWLSTFDGRTRDSHARLNGQEAKDGQFRIDGYKSIGPGLWGIASEDINCRCSTYFKLEGFDYSPDWKYQTWKKELEIWKQEAPVINKKP